MRQEVIDIVEKHLQNISNSHYFQWLGRPLDKDEFPAIVLQDTEAIYIESKHTLRFEIIVIQKDKVSADVAKETRAMMQKVSNAFSEALSELCLFGKLLKTKLDAESSEYAYIQGLMLFEVTYISDEWSV